VTYEEALAALDRRELFGIRLGLENVRAIFDRLGRPELAYPTLHVAGTNGKGTTAAALASLAQAHGLRPGLYTSPHLVDFRERIRIDDLPVERAEVIAGWERIASAVEERGMTYFEATTILALDYFARARVDLAVIEVGLGGRLDATNVIRPEVAVVTGVARDHERWLGESLSAIAREKAGIFKPVAPALVGDPGPPEVRAVWTAAAAAVGAPLAFLPEEVTWSVRSVEPGRTRFDYGSPTLRLDELELPLTGSVFARAAALAVHTWERLANAPGPVVPEIDEARVRSALAGLTLGGRGEWREVGGIPHLFDVAHNPAGCERLAATVGELGRGRAALVFGALADKAWPRMLDALAPATARAWVCGLETAGARRLMREDARAEVEGRGMTWSETVAQALAAAGDEVARGKAGFVLVAGSFHTVGEALVALGIAAPGEPYAPAPAAAVGPLAPASTEAPAGPAAAPGPSAPARHGELAETAP
jgi:dihydrofolate synthase/folylpolyglutamate synthase